MGPSLASQTFAVVDVETTGFSPVDDRVVEVGCVVVRAGRVLHTFGSLVDPGRPVPARAAAVHHLTDDLLAGAPQLAEVAPQLAAYCDGAIVVAHNASFDMSFLPMLAQHPRLCTLRLARRTFPELPSYAMQALRYALGADAAFPAARAHRALDDARLTAKILTTLLARYLERGEPDDVEALLAYSRAPLTRRAA